MYDVDAVVEVEKVAVVERVAEVSGRELAARSVRDRRRDMVL